MATQGRVTSWALAGGVALLVAAVAVAAALTQVEDATVNPKVATTPVTLAAGALGTTTLNSASTSASTTRTALANVAVEVLTIHRVSGSWDVTIRIDSATGTGMSVGNSATIREVLGVTNNAQGTATAISATVTSITGTPGSVVTISGATDIAIQVTSTHAVGATMTLGMTVLIVPSGGTNPVLSYSYTLLLN